MPADLAARLTRAAETASSEARAALWREASAAVTFVSSAYTCTLRDLVAARSECQALRDRLAALEPLAAPVWPGPGGGGRDG